MRRYPELSSDELSFHLVEARDRILPEVSDKPGEWVVRSLTKRGAHVHLNAHLLSASGSHVVLSTGEEFDSELIVWTVGNAANPMVHNHTDLPIDGRGMLLVRPDLRVGTEGAPVPEAWGAGDDAAIPDLAAERPGVSTVPNAQHAVRQGKLLARKLIATLRGREPRPYVHHSLGVVATLGLGLGIFQFHRLVIKGFPAWLMHRGYHALAVPTWERKVRVLAVWATAVPFGRDIVSLPRCSTPGRHSWPVPPPACPSPPKRRMPGWTLSRQAMPRVHDDAVRRLAAACRAGDGVAIEAVLDPDAVAVCDSGGHVPAPLRPVHGAAQIARLIQALLPGADLTVESVNGRAALLVRRAGTAVAVITVACHEDRATTLWAVLNPAKLRGWHRG
ncbi:hypothetical protein FRACA_470028 [Frankia canadensis]|uniref:FAD/NAD(P)-binding domain-containing protein n=2 Tax=Frankia canadensis TaxID=1836972 RepID=A0A2I2KXU9_9ACTN|nr:FAD-dependent oxidoreductase [Frankia canadensis]SNQ50480.1 hypothetical protein FRACA_470028 [Frankia canadensis]SOU57770.1 hypothetical protein FRACA_470028 [Frankia canadensis]